MEKCKCPVCRSGKLFKSVRKKIFGLVKVEEFICNKCNATFVKKADKYKLSKVLDKSNKIWQEYGNQTLTEREWKNIANGGMSDEKQREKDILFWLNNLRKGKVNIEIEEEAPILLKKNEKLKIVLHDISLLEPRKVVIGGYGGPSFRIAKGVYFRLGGFRAQSREELKMIDKGIFTLTNKRIVFFGTKRNVNIDLKKIASVEPYKNGVIIRRSDREKPQYFTGIDKVKLTIEIKNRKYVEPLSGQILVYLIEGLAGKNES